MDNFAYPHFYMSYPQKHKSYPHAQISEVLEMSILPNFAIIGTKWNFISYPQLDFSKKCDKIKLYINDIS